MANGLGLVQRGRRRELPVGVAKVTGHVSLVLHGASEGHRPHLCKVLGPFRELRGHAFPEVLHGRVVEIVHDLPHLAAGNCGLCRASRNHPLAHDRPPGIIEEPGRLLNDPIGHRWLGWRRGSVQAGQVNGGTRDLARQCVHALAGFLFRQPGVLLHRARLDRRGRRTIRSGPHDGSAAERRLRFVHGVAADLTVVEPLLLQLPGLRAESGPFARRAPGELGHFLRVQCFGQRRLELGYSGPGRRTSDPETAAEQDHHADLARDPRGGQFLVPQRRLGDHHAGSVGRPLDRRSCRCFHRPSGNTRRSRASAHTERRPGRLRDLRPGLRNAGNRGAWNE